MTCGSRANVKLLGSVALGLLAVLVGPVALSAADGQARFFVGPKDARRTKTLKDGRAIIAYHQSGTVSSQDSGPFSEGAYFAQGTIVKDAAGDTLADVSLFEITDADGDLAWGVIWLPENGPKKLSIKAGTGKWKGIAGEGRPAEEFEERADGHAASVWGYEWEIANRASAALRGKPEDYEFHDEGLSFHGPHIKELSKKLETGVELVVSNQSGVLLSKDPAAKSPRNFATCYDRGTTYLSPEGENLGDVMLLEDTDPDGDVVWLYHEWWYGKGPGSYEFIGGVGKWRGIRGYGKTLGMLRERADDHYMLKSEMHWNIEK